MKKCALFCALLSTSALLLTATPALAAKPVNAGNTSSVFVPVNRSTLVTLSSQAAEVAVANPAIADVHVHDATHLTVVAKSLGHTTVRILDRQNQVLRELDIVVGYDLPAIRKSLKTFLPDENIGVDMVNNSVALTGLVRNAGVVDKALKIASQFVSDDSKATDTPQANDAASAMGESQQQDANTEQKSKSQSTVLNFLQVGSGQQVMLRVRVGEIQRSALKELGVDLNVIGNGRGTSVLALGTGGGIASLVAPATGETAVSPGTFLLPGGQSPDLTRGIFTGRWQPGGANGNTYAGLIKALERDGLFKVLAEPNLTAVSGEEAEFLSGGEIPIPVVQGGVTNTVSIIYKPFGVAVKFTPVVLSESRIHINVQPEVSEVSDTNAVILSGFRIPAIETRRAKTTVELAPGESFMIAGLISDQTRANIDQIPGAKELPVLGALFRSTEFRRNETELVIAVTPYVVDPIKSSDVKLPTDDFRPASQGEMFFFGALGSLAGRPGSAPTPSLEGPTGFMVD